MNRPRTKSNGVQFAENAGFQSFMEDEVNMKNRVGGEMNIDGNYMQQATPEILTNDRQKHYSQVNYYAANQYNSTKSSYQSPSRKQINLPLQNNQDIITIKRDSVKFLNEREFTTAPNLKETHTQ